MKGRAKSKHVAPAEQSSMTATEILAELKSLRDEIGPCADLYLSLGVSEYRDEQPVYASIKANGLARSDGPSFSVHGTDFRIVLADLRKGWAEFQDEHARRMTTDMALEIIRITDAQGACTDASLRGDKFTVADVALWGSAAFAKANELAGRGPFEIVAIGGANGAAA